jgi:hypothetical protein
MSYYSYFLTGTNNQQINNQDLDTNRKGELSDQQKEFVAKAVAVERNTNLISTILASIFLVGAFGYGALTTKPAEDGDTTIQTLLLYSFVGVLVVVVLGIFFSLILPYQNAKIFKVYTTSGELSKKVVNMDSFFGLEIKVGKVKFWVGQNVFDYMQDGKNYTLYYTKTPKQNLLVGVDERGETAN